MRHTLLIARTLTALALIALMGIFHPQGVSAGTPPHRLDSGTGWVLSNPEVYNLYWDNNWNSDNPSFSIDGINNATSNLLHDGYLAGAGQYGVGNGSFKGWHDTGGLLGGLCGPRRAPNTVHFATILAWLTCKVATPGTGVPYPSVRLPVSNTLYVVYLPSTTNIDDDLSIPAMNILGQHIGPITIVNEHSCGQGGYDGYHSFSAGLTSLFAYAIVVTHCTAQDGGGLSDITQTASHEIVEAATNPFNVLSWMDRSLSLGDDFDRGEAADICSSDSGGAVPTAPFSLPSGVVVSTYWSNADNRCLPAPTVRPKPAPRVHVDGLPLPLGVPVTTKISATDAGTGAPLAGTATINSFDAHGHPMELHEPTNVPFSATFYSGVAKTRECEDDPKPHCYIVTEEVYPGGIVNVPGYTPAPIPFSFTDPVPHRLVVTVSPGTALPEGRPIPVTVQALNSVTHQLVVGRVILNGQDVGATNTPFTATFLAPPTGLVRAAGYPDTTIHWPAVQLSHLQASISPHPVPLKQSVSVTVTSADADSTAHEVVAGTVTIHNYDSSGQAVDQHFSTNTPFTTTFYTHVIRTRECDSTGLKPRCWWDIETDYPTATVSAPGFVTQDLDLGLPQ